MPKMGLDNFHFFQYIRYNPKLPQERELRMFGPGAFLIGLALSLTVSLAVVTYLRSHLAQALQEVSTQKRAHFWTAFWVTTLALIPLLCAMSYAMQFQGGFFNLSAQLTWALIGLTGWLLFLAMAVLLSGPAGPSQSLREPEEDSP